MKKPMFLERNHTVTEIVDANDLQSMPEMTPILGRVGLSASVIDRVAEDLVHERQKNRALLEFPENEWQEKVARAETNPKG